MTENRKELIEKLVTNVEALGFQTKFEADDGSNDINAAQRLVVGKAGHVIGKASLILAGRVNTMFNGVGRNEIELLKVLTRFSVQL